MPRYMVREHRYYQLYFSLLAKFAQTLLNRPTEFSTLLRLVEQGLQLEKGVRESCQQAFDSARESKNSCAYYASQLASEFKKRPHVLAKALAGLIQISLVDRRIPRQCDLELEHIARLFGLTRRDYREIRSHFIPGEVSTEVRNQTVSGSVTDLEVELLEILGCQAGASSAEARRAYRQLALNNHPDIYASLDLDPRVRQELVENFQRIQAAYIRLRDLRRLQ